MKSLMLALAMIVSATPALADFVGSHETLFREQNACPDSDLASVRKFKTMLNRFEAENDPELRQKPQPTIEIAEYGAWQTLLIDLKNGEECYLFRHEDCYSAQCQ